MKNQKLPEDPINPYEPPNGDSELNPHKAEEDKKLSAGKLIAIWLLAIAVLTWLFGKWEEQVYYPEQSTSSELSNQHKNALTS